MHSKTQPKTPMLRILLICAVAAAPWSAPAANAQLAAPRPPIPQSAIASAPAQQLAVPDPATLLHEVIARQKQLDLLRENYAYTEIDETKDLDRSGAIKETKTEEYEIMFVKGRPIRRLVKRDGKPLDAGEEKKQQERAAKEIEKASSGSAEEQRDKDEVSISHIIENTQWTNSRREPRNGRSAIAFDFTSDPHANTHGEAEDIFKNLSGTVWVDERDKTIVRLTARFDHDFHVGAGLLASVHKGSTVTLDQGLINNEVWLPVKMQAHFDARIMLFKGISEEVTQTSSNYHRFSVQTTQQAGSTVHSVAP